MHMSKQHDPVSKAALVGALAMVLAAIPAAAPAANNSEQVVFSGIGLPPTSSEPFGFWIWCQNQPASQHAAYDTDCNGAMYFYARGVTAHVTGEVTEPSEGTYNITVSSRDRNVQCMLTNVPPIQHGPHNTVIAQCTVNGESLTGLRSTTAVVNATGP
jgi:hypothetical protein